VGQLNYDAGALSKLEFADGQTTKILNVSDTAANISSALDGLNQDAQIGEVTITDNQAITLSLAQDTSDTAILSELRNANGTPVTLNIVNSEPTSQTYTLGNGANTITGNGGNDTIIAAFNTLGAQDAIDGGTGSSTLALQGPGTFDLRVPATLTDIATITAQEGQVYSPGIPGTSQQLYLRDGLNTTVNVIPDLALNSQNPNAPSIIIHGANNADTINLGSGTDTVYVGSNAETVNGGTGRDYVYVTAPTAGATINGNAQTYLQLAGGGTLQMGNNLQVAQVDLQGSTPWNVVANNEANLSLVDYTGGTNTLTLGNASQSVGTGNGSTDRIIATTAAEAGASVVNYASPTTNDIFEITAGGVLAPLNYQTKNVTVQLDQASTLTLNQQSGVNVTGTTGGDTIIAESGSIEPTNSLTLGGSNNTLELQGGGTFDLRAPASVTGIGTITLQEGQPAYYNASTNLSIATSEPTLYLRNGLNATVNVLADTSPLNPQNTYPAGAIIYGANDADTINLGAGTDTVYVGSNAETINGGTGTDYVTVTAATIAATVNGGKQTDLELTGGGTLTMGANDKNLFEVDLQTASKAYNFTANNAANTRLVDYSGGANTITLGNVSQSVGTGNGSNDRIIATAAEAGASISNYSTTAEDTIEITGGGTAVLNAYDKGIAAVQLDKATKLTENSHIGTIIGSSDGNDVILDTAANLNGTTVKNFVPSDDLDITGLAFTPQTKISYVANAGGQSGVLTVSNATGVVDKINIQGQVISFKAASDGKGGTLITDPPLANTTPASPSPATLESSNSALKAFNDAAALLELVGGVKDDALSPSVSAMWHPAASTALMAQAMASMGDTGGVDGSAYNPLHPNETQLQLLGLSQAHYDHHVFG